MPKYDRFVEANHLPGAKRRFRMGAAGRRFANTKYGRAVVIAILEEWSLICVVAVAAGATIMVAAMLYNDWSAAQ